jgi:hypothetical protein
MAHHQEEPATSIIRLFGGVGVVASIVKKHPSRVYRWTYPTSVREGTGGIVPAREQRALLDYARDQAIDFKPEDFFSAERLHGVLSQEQEAAE